MTLAHVLGLPVEESVLQLVPVGATVATAIVITGRTTFGRLRRWATRDRSIKDPTDRIPSRGGSGRAPSRCRGSNRAANFRNRAAQPCGSDERTRWAISSPIPRPPELGDRGLGPVARAVGGDRGPRLQPLDRGVPIGQLGSTASANLPRVARHLGGQPARGGFDA